MPNTSIPFSFFERAFYWNSESDDYCGSGIKEFDDCLPAIDDMRDALRESLEKQWKLIAALIVLGIAQILLNYLHIEKWQCVITVISIGIGVIAVIYFEGVIGCWTGLENLI